jgi:hypothetical protein
MLLVQSSFDTDDAPQSSYEHDAQQSVGAVRERVERARRPRAEDFYARGALSGLRPHRSTRTLGGRQYP